MWCFLSFVFPILQPFFPSIKGELLQNWSVTTGTSSCTSGGNHMTGERAKRGRFTSPLFLAGGSSCRLEPFDATKGKELEPGWALPWNAWAKFPVPCRGVATPLQISALFLLWACENQSKGPGAGPESNSHTLIGVSKDFYLGSLCSLIPLGISLLSNWGSAWSHADQGSAFTSQRLLGVVCLLKEFQEGGKQEEKIAHSLCVVLFSTEISLDERSHSGWISWNLVSDFFGLGLLS